MPLLLILSSLGHAQNQDYPDPKPEIWNAPYPMIQGPTSESTTQISFLHPRAFEYQIEWLEATSLKKAKIRVKKIRSSQRPDSQWKVDQFFITEMNPKEKYLARILHPIQKTVLDEREFKGLDLKKSAVRFGLASCQDDAYPQEQALIWKQIWRQSPDLFFFIGDNVYADRFIGPYVGPAPDQTIWRRYVNQWLSIDVYRMKSLIPVLATWDDHDYGKNDGDASFLHKKESTKIFRDFFPQSKIPGVYETGPGVSAHLKAFGRDFFLMDNRSFRSKQPESHWGAKQETWLLQNLSASNRPSFIFDGTQFFGGYVPQKESFQSDHPNQFQAFLTSLKKIESPVVFISGDAHLTELMEIPSSILGYSTYELTTSGIHAKIFERWGKHPNPFQIAGNDKKFNYALVDLTNDLNTFEVAVYSLNEEKLYSRKLTLKDSRPKPLVTSTITRKTRPTGRE